MPDCKKRLLLAMFGLFGRKMFLSRRELQVVSRSGVVSLLCESRHLGRFWEPPFGATKDVASRSSSGSDTLTSAFAGQIVEDSVVPGPRYLLLRKTSSRKSHGDMHDSNVFIVFHHIPMFLRPTMTYTSSDPSQLLPSYSTLRDDQDIQGYPLPGSTVGPDLRRSSLRRDSAVSLPLLSCRAATFFTQLLKSAECSE